MVLLTSLCNSSDRGRLVTAKHSLGAPSCSPKHDGECVWFPHSLLHKGRGGTHRQTCSLSIFAFTAFGEGWKRDVFSRAQSITYFSVVSQITLFQVCEGFTDLSQRPLKSISIILPLELKANLPRLSRAVVFYTPSIRRQDHRN